MNNGMRQAALFGVILLAFGLGLFKAVRLPAPASFQVRTSSGMHRETAYFHSDFASSRLHTQTHAASLIELQDGRIRAFWFSGSREGAPDVEIHSAVFDPARGQWGAEQSVIDRERTQHALQRYIAKLGNPVAARAADGSLWLYYVTVSVGGWAGSSIAAMHSADEGETWSAPQRLITSPFFNVSTLVRNALISYSDGTLGFPVYHEFISKFGELLRLDSHGSVIDKQRLAPGGRGTLQPVLLVRNAHEARVLMRHAGPPPHRALSITTQDAGKHWTSPAWSELRNPDSAISAIVLPDGRMLAALNDIEYGRDALSLMISADGGVTWKTVYQLEDQRGQKTDQANFMDSVAGLLKRTDGKVAALRAAELHEYLASVQQQSCSPPGCHYEFSYPFLLQTQHGEFHLAYTWNRSFIKHVQFNQAWLDQQVERAK